MCREIGDLKPSGTPYFASRFVPRPTGRSIHEFESRAYSGQYSRDGTLFYATTQDLTVHVYDTTDNDNWREFANVHAEFGRWTLTDAIMSSDNKFLAYSSITPIVYMVNSILCSCVSYFEVSLDNPDRPQALRVGNVDDLGLWSIKFSADNRELIAGNYQTHNLNNLNKV